MAKNFIFITMGKGQEVVYLVVSGKIKISKTNDDGKEFITSIHGPGEYFGYTAILEMSIIKKMRRLLKTQP
jgi:CRP-like cAMP-binding protein